MNLVKRFYYGLIEFFLDRCMCGGRFDDHGYLKRAWCDRCGHEQFTEYKLQPAPGFVSKPVTD